MIKFHSKSKTLLYLDNLVINAKILPQFSFNVLAWKKSNKDICKIWVNRPHWSHKKLIIRSSSLSEDGIYASKAGKFLTIMNVSSDKEINQAVNEVINSYGKSLARDEIFIQPMLENIDISGVAFSKDPNNGGYYYVVNYDDFSGKADTVTSGQGRNLKIFYHVKDKPLPKIVWKKKLILLLRELEFIFQSENLDIEFGIDKSGDLYLFQVRPLVVDFKKTNKSKYNKELNLIFKRINSLIKPHPYLFGEKTLFGIMPDWNPAEIIGIRPKPLAFSLYKELITDGVWAYQRSNYGYRNLRSFPLLLSLGGLPYIDVRVSFNSFIPNDLNHKLANKLVNYYLNRLENNESMHDKVEFDILFSCYTFDLPERIKDLSNNGFTKREQNTLLKHLKKLTNKIIDEKNGLWKKDINRLTELEKRQVIINNSNLNILDKIYWLLEDCKRYGTLPFAGLARAGFVAVQLLQSILNLGIITKKDYEMFMESLETISSSLQEDFNLNKGSFLKKYGHLRPGTYEITIPRYDENPNLYIKNEQNTAPKTQEKRKNFSLSQEKINKLEKLIKAHGLDQSVTSIFNFIKSAIEGREFAKFIFTKSLSDILSLIKILGKRYNLDPEQLSYSNINDFKQAYSTTSNIKDILNKSIKIGINNYSATCMITLPPLIKNPEEIFSFHLTSSDPNFITQKIIQAEVVFEGAHNSDLKGRILMIENADPGYDWIFLHDITCFITKYGGINSHMAIRAAELGIPAVIGSGEVLFESWSKSKILNIDCANKTVRIIS